MANLCEHNDLNSMSVLGLNAENSAISFTALLCMNARDGFGLPGRTYSPGIFGTSSHFLNSLGGILNCPQSAVRLVQGLPYHQGSYSYVGSPRNSLRTHFAGFSITQNFGLHSAIILWHSRTIFIHSSGFLAFPLLLAVENSRQTGLAITP